MKRFQIALSLICVFTATVFTGCDITNSEEYVPEYIVESYQFAGEPFGEVRLSRTVPVGTAYIFEEQAVVGAQVTVKQLDASGEVVRTIPFRESVNRGIYNPVDLNTIVQPRATYSLEVQIPNEETMLRAQTIVPDTFSIRAISSDTVIFQLSQQVEVVVTRSFYPGRQNIFVSSTEALDFREEQLTPFIADLYDPQTDDLEDFRINESPPFNEENYTFNPDGTITIDIPWIAFSFFGPNRVTLLTLDDNVFDIARSQVLQVQPSSLSPGEIPSIIEHVDGGTGVFGSYARVTLNVFIQRPL